jgi:hypothetical protein
MLHFHVSYRFGRDPVEYWTRALTKDNAQSVQASYQRAAGYRDMQLRPCKLPTCEWAGK